MKRTKRLLSYDRGLTIWLAVFAVLAFTVALAPSLLPSALDQNPIGRLHGPSAAHWLGTDDFGRDIFARLVVAGRVSLGVGLGIALSATVMGSIIGLVSGYYLAAGSVLMRLMDALMAFPGVVLAVALVAAIGSGARSEVIALAVVFTPYIARVVRSQVITIANRGYIYAARAAGLSGPKILLAHVLPNSLPTILVQLVIAFASALLLDGSLSFLGLGVQPPTPTWGNMIAEARQYLTTSPLFVTAPGIAIILAVVTLNAIARGLRNVVDPHARALHRLISVRRAQVRAPRIPRTAARTPAGGASAEAGVSA